MNGFVLVLLILSLLLLVVIAWFLFAPLWVVIDTKQQRFFAEIRGLVKIRAVPGEKGWQTFWHPFHSKRHVKVQHRKFSGKLLHKAVAVVRTFRVKKLVLDIDTGDVILNAYLFPVFFLLSNSSRKLNINYNGELIFILEMKNRVARIIRAMLFG